MEEYSNRDTIQDLSSEQLEGLAKSDFSYLLEYIEDSTNYDAQRIRLLLELGRAEAAKQFRIRENSDFFLGGGIPVAEMHCPNCSKKTMDLIKLVGWFCSKCDSGPYTYGVNGFFKTAEQERYDRK